MSGLLIEIKEQIQDTESKLYKNIDWSIKEFEKNGIERLEIVKK